MGIFARIRGFFCCCIRSPTSGSLNNEENRRLLGPKSSNVCSTQSNPSLSHIPSASTNYLNYGTPKIRNISNKVRKPIKKARIPQHEGNTATTVRQPDIKPPYFLQTFICNLSSSQMGKPSVTPASDVIYTNEWTVCTAIILNESSQRLSPQHTLELSSDSHVEFRDCKLQNGCLHFSMKAHNAGTITIFFKIKNSFTVSKTISVRYNPCSTVQAEMTIKSINEFKSASGHNKCVFQVSIVDVWGASHKSYELDILSSGENEVIQKKRMHSEAGHINFEITVRGKEPWSKDFVAIFNDNGQPVPHAKNIEVFDILRKICRRALIDGDYEFIPDFIEFYGSRIFIPLTIGDDDGKFISYNEQDNCEILPGAKVILCKNVKKDELLGSGFAHVNNISRALKLKDYLDIQEIPAENIVIIGLDNVHPNRYDIFKVVVQHLLRGLYYRKKASEAAAIRMEWKRRSSTLGKLLGTCPSMKVCKNFRDHFGNLMNRYNREACNELFTFFNFNRDVSEVDLHGLYVADEKNLENLRLDLLRGLGNEGRNKRSREVDAIIKKNRAEGDEAIRKLNEKLENFNVDDTIKNNTPWLEIIVGAGRHSRIKNEQNIRPKVEKLLKERNLPFAPVNKGSLVVTFQAYSGPEPCFGEYYCEKCDRTWKSNKSYVGKYQKCPRCQDCCWPVKQRKKEKVKKNFRL